MNLFISHVSRNIDFNFLKFELLKLGKKRIFGILNSYVDKDILVKFLKIEGGLFEILNFCRQNNGIFESR